VKARFAYLGLALLVLAGGALAYGLTRPAPEVVVEQPECDTCSARKQSLSRLREALSAPDGEAAE
jgi:hypothetical protein